METLGVVVLVLSALVPFVLYAILRCKLRNVPAKRDCLVLSGEITSTDRRIRSIEHQSKRGLERDTKLRKVLHHGVTPG